ncbi:S-adenosyl-L-methionine-dependent methyltransferases superfamily protein [Hibiscus syriacus]|uniref:S-adenosyl-L-methionine-dependent methyltransferases superfamily protein n=1 Tax=Hibiscus syriacus TaxID=106335 RepID=A0A6A2ZQS8_HIBSY|nr:S-adenosyl-L-methionine-dependent methyltransferases superfamily protein [Hibiscus syriacus]
MALRNEVDELKELLICKREMSELDALKTFLEGLRPGAMLGGEQGDAQRLSKAIAVVGKLTELAGDKLSSDVSSKPMPRGKQSGKNGKAKSGVKKKGSKENLKCYFCDGPHLIRGSTKPGKRLGPIDEINVTKQGSIQGNVVDVEAVEPGRKPDVIASVQAIKTRERLGEATCSKVAESRSKSGATISSQVVNSGSKRDETAGVKAVEHKKGLSAITRDKAVKPRVQSEQVCSQYARMEAWFKLRLLRHKGTLKEYVSRYIKFMLKVSSLTEEDGFFTFMFGLKSWAKRVLERREVKELSKALIIAEFIKEFGVKKNKTSKRKPKVEGSGKKLCDEGKSEDEECCSSSDRENPLNDEPDGESGEGVCSLGTSSSVKYAKPRVRVEQTRGIDGLAEDVQVRNNPSKTSGQESKGAKTLRDKTTTEKLPNNKWVYRTVTTDKLKFTAIFTDICTALCSSNPSTFLFILVVVPTVVCLTAAFFLHESPPASKPSEFQQETQYFNIFNVMAITLAIYLLAFDINGSLLSSVFAVGLLILLATPLGVPLYYVLSKPSSDSDIKQPIKVPLLANQSKTKMTITGVELKYLECKRLSIGEDHAIVEMIQAFDFWVLFVSFLCGVGTRLIWGFFGRIASGLLSEYFIRKFGTPRPLWNAASQVILAMRYMIMAFALPGSLYIGSMLVGICYSSISTSFSHKKISVVLDEMNYLPWKQQILLTVRSHRLERLLTGALQSPPETILDDTALIFFLIFASRSTTAAMSLHCKLQSLRKGNDSMRVYLTRVKDVCDALASCGSAISHVGHVASILKGLPREYQPFMAVITTMKETLSLDSLYTVLLDAEAQLAGFEEQFDYAPMVTNVAERVEDHDSSANGRRDSNSSRSSFTNRTGGRGRAGNLQANTVSRSSDHWVVDSGATHHITPDALTVGNGVSVDIHNVGNAVVSSASSRTLILTELLHVPHITKNLFSVSKLSRDNKVYLEFHAEKCFVRDEFSKAILLQGEEKGGLYTFSLSDFSTEGCGAAVHLATSDMTQSELWHRRLGHPASFALSKIAKELDVKLDIDVNKTCVACFMGKSHKLPFSSSNTEYTAPFELVFSDLWGPPHIASNGFRYYVTFVDAFTRFTWLYLLKDKAQAVDVFHLFKKLVANQFGRIVHRLTCPYTSEQNGVVEREHRHVVELGLVLLAQASLPMQYWSYAFVTAVHLINLLPTVVLGGMTPYEKLYQKKPEFASLKVFGCQCFPHLRPFQNHKLCFRSQSCTYLGIKLLHVVHIMHKLLVHVIFQLLQIHAITGATPHSTSTGYRDSAHDNAHGDNVYYNNNGILPFGIIHAHNAHGTNGAMPMELAHNNAHVGAISDDAHATTPLNNYNIHGAVPIEIIQNDAHEICESIEVVHHYAVTTAHINVPKDLSRGHKDHGNCPEVIKILGNCPEVIKILGNCPEVPKNLGKLSICLERHRGNRFPPVGVSVPLWHSGILSFEGVSVPLEWLNTHEARDNAALGEMATYDNAAHSGATRLGALSSSSTGNNRANGVGATSSGVLDASGVESLGATRHTTNGATPLGVMSTLHSNSTGDNDVGVTPLGTVSAYDDSTLHSLENNGNYNIIGATYPGANDLNNANTSPVIEELDLANNIQSTSTTLSTRGNHHPMKTRSKCGVFKPKAYSTHFENDTPSTIQEALQSTNWKEAVQAEVDALQRNDTWRLVKLPEGRTPIGCKWLFKLKRNPDGSIHRYKVQLVAKGYSQVPGYDFLDTFSPVVKFSSLNVVLTLAVSNDWELRHIDINNAFLNGDLSEDVFIQQPPGFVQLAEDGSVLVCKLQKALYGLHSSLFVCKRGTGDIYVLVYVDDIVITGHSSSEIQEVVRLLSEIFSLKDLGALRFFLGIEVHRSRGSLFLNQKIFLLELLEKTSMAGAAACSTPMILASKLSKDAGELLSNDVGKVAQFMHAPREPHWLAVKRILRYLVRTVNYGLMFQASEAELSVSAFADADWGANIDDRRSISGYDLGIQQRREPVIWFDNTGAVAMSANPVYHAHAKHIDLDIHFVREKVAAGLLKINYIPGAHQITDGFTKPLSKSAFEEFRHSICVMPGGCLLDIYMTPKPLPLPEVVTPVLGLIVIALCL